MSCHRITTFPVEDLQKEMETVKKHKGHVKTYQLDEESAVSFVGGAGGRQKLKARDFANARFLQKQQQRKEMVRSRLAAKLLAKVEGAGTLVSK